MLDGILTPWFFYMFCSATFSPVPDGCVLSSLSGVLPPVSASPTVPPVPLSSPCSPPLFSAIAGTGTGVLFAVVASASLCCPLPSSSIASAATGVLLVVVASLFLPSSGGTSRSPARSPFAVVSLFSPSSGRTSRFSHFSCSFWGWRWHLCGSFCPAWL